MSSTRFRTFLSPFVTGRGALLGVSVALGARLFFACTGTNASGDNRLRDGTDATSGGAMVTPSGGNAQGGASSASGGTLTGSNGSASGGATPSGTGGSPSTGATTGTESDGTNGDGTGGAPPSSTGGIPSGGTAASGAPSTGGTAGSSGAPSAGAANAGSGGESANDGGNASSNAGTSGSGESAGGGNAGDDAGASGSGGGSSGPTQPSHGGPWRIMPLGDSITGTSCYPQQLSKKLRDARYTNFEFVGTVLNNQACNGAPNVQSEGHGGYLVRDLANGGSKAGELVSWFRMGRPDVVLMHFGTNDVWNAVPTQTILDAYGAVIDAARAENASVIVLLAQIIPMNPSGCGECESRVVALNAAIPDFAARKSTPASPIHVIDLHSVFDPAAFTSGSPDTSDGVHPTPAGAQKMTDAWYAALIGLDLL